MVTKFFKPRVHTGWRKNLPAKTRRAKVLKAHKGDVLASGRSLQALANTTQDKRTAELSGLDARYFFRKLKGG